MKHRKAITRKAFLATTVGALSLVSACTQTQNESEFQPTTETPIPETHNTSQTPTTVQETTQSDTVSDDEPGNITQEESGSPEDQSVSVLDLHADTIDILAMNAYPPYSLNTHQYFGTLESNNAQVAHDRMGNLRWAQCYAIWLPDEDYAISHLNYYRTARDWFFNQMELFSDSFEQPRSLKDIEAILNEGKSAAILTVENAACLDAGIEIVEEFAQDGVLIAGVTWNGQNVLGSGYDTQIGLTELGRNYITALEEHNIVVDISHLNDQGFWDVEAIAKRPYIATHSNSRAICNHPRNLTDDQFLALIAHGGIVGLNFHQNFVVNGGGSYNFDQLIMHLEHWIDLEGASNIALGGDRDGADIPYWIAASQTQEQFFIDIRSYFGERLARKLFFENAMAFFKRYTEET